METRNHSASWSHLIGSIFYGKFQKDVRICHDPRVFTGWDRCGRSLTARQTASCLWWLVVKDKQHGDEIIEVNSREVR
jgi:hypothetical protein